MEKFILNCQKKVLAGKKITKDEAFDLLSIDNKEYLLLLMHIAHTVRRKYKGDMVDLCSLVNAKSGKCSEDCKYCAQSSHYQTNCNTYPFIGVDEIIKKAKEAKKMGIHRFCIVTSGGEVTNEEFEKIISAVKTIRDDVGLDMDCSLGHLTDEKIQDLKKAGVSRYNHNLETSDEYFSNICSTHTFLDRMKTIKRVKKNEMELCCGGIIGMGENITDRLNLAFKLRDLETECVPINILNPRQGTPLQNELPLTPFEILKTISVFRLILPTSTIKIAGGREHNLRNLQAMSLLAGGNGFIVNGYLTTSGQLPNEDFQMLKDLELHW